MKIAMWLLAAASMVAMADSARAADLGPEPAPIAPIAAVNPAYDWSGTYLGLQGGYNWGHSTSAYDFAPFTAVAIDPMNATGWSGGIEGGVNHQFANRFVLGIEADASLASITDTIPDVAGTLDTLLPQTLTSKTDFGGNLRARFGFAFDRTLLFGAAGVTASHVTVTATDGDLADHATLIGWTIGGGIEQAVTNRVSVKAEYLYSGFPNHTWFEGEPYSSTSTASGSTVRVGVNVRF